MNALWTVVAALAAAAIGFLVGTLRAARRAENLRAQLAEATTKLATEEQALARNAELLRQSEAQVRLAIESSSRAALDANSQTFIKLANEIFGRNHESATVNVSPFSRDDNGLRALDHVRR